MKNKIIALGIALALPVVAQADTLGFLVGANTWSQSMTGQVQSGSSQIDVQNELSIDDQTQGNFYLAFEHPIPIIPNVRVQHTLLDMAGSNTLTEDIDFEGITFPAGSEIDSIVDLTHTDATFYYEVLDNWISLDLGLTARIFKEGVAITSTGESAALTIEQTIPLVYAMAKFEIPATGLYVSARGNGVTYSSNTLVDLEANLGYEFDFGLGVEAGYRIFQLDYEDSSTEAADVKVDGAYVGVFYHF